MQEIYEDPQIKERFVQYDKNLKKQFKVMPPLEEIHDPSKAGSIEVVPYTMDTYAFFEEYKKDLDAERVIKMLSIPRSRYKQWLDQPKFTDVLNRIHQAYEDAVLMDAKTVAGWSVEILRDIHDAFKNGNDKAASALAAMAGNMLRASGNFKETTQATPQVLIQINTSDPNTLLKTAKSTPDKVSDININLNPNKKENDDQSIANLSILCGE
tara:strand:+ start:107 stop:742 length:636 start_codon:yes stop_codon:yes gene_type:complete